MTPRPLTDAERAELRELLAKCKALIGPRGEAASHYDVGVLDAYLRNHAEALLDAADENARLRAMWPCWGCNGNGRVGPYERDTPDGSEIVLRHDCERCGGTGCYPRDAAFALAAATPASSPLAAAADERDRLKAGAPLVYGEVYLRAGSRSGKTDTLAAAHTTHFDDCGCRSARYEAEIALLKAKLAAVREHAATFDNADGESAFLSIVDCSYNEPLHYHHDGCPECTEHAPPTTFRDDSATTPEGYEEHHGS